MFSEIKNGLFCKYCAIFCHKTLVGGQQTVPLKKLVIEPLQKYAKLAGEGRDLEKHATTNYHKNAEIDCKLFMTVFKNPQQQIINRLSESRKA